MGNATHVAIALGDGTVYESTSGGVQISSISRFTDFGLIKDVDYTGGDPDEGEGSTESKQGLIRGYIASIRDYLNLIEEVI